MIINLLKKEYFNFNTKIGKFIKYVVKTGKDLNFC